MLLSSFIKRFIIARKVYSDINSLSNPLYMRDFTLLYYVNYNNTCMKSERFHFKKIHIEC